MTTQEWEAYMKQLEQEQQESETHCVSCWYEENEAEFPAADSSSLCGQHAQAIRNDYHTKRNGRYA